MPGDECDECEHEYQDHKNDRLHSEKSASSPAFHNVFVQAHAFVIHDDGAVFLSCAAVTSTLIAMTLRPRLGSFLFFERRKLRSKLGCVALPSLCPVLK